MVHFFSSFRFLTRFGVSSALGALMLLLVPSSMAATFSLNPSSGAYNQTCEVSVDIILDSQGSQTNAADLFVSYDPNQLTLIDQDVSQPGPQIKAGSYYQLYVSNNVDEGTGSIQMSAFSLMGEPAKSAVFATLVFESKPGVNSSTISVDFDGAGATTDSNIADLGGSDILSGVTNGSYTFNSGFCNPDVQAPQVNSIVPANGADGVSLGSNVSFAITDNQSGVDLSSLSVQIHNVTYDQNSTELSVSGTSSNYSIVIDPAVDFPDNTLIGISIQASDIAGNVMSTVVSNFNPPDTQAPTLANVSPANGERSIPLNSDITFNVRDNDVGVDLSTLQVNMGGNTYTNSSPELSFSGSANDYSIVVDPTTDFPFNTAVTFVISAADLGGNIMSPRSFTFNSPDQQPPNVSQMSPSNGSTGNSLDANISFRLTDNEVGVDLDALEVDVQGVTYTTSSSELTTSGTALDYDVLLNPSADFPINTEITVQVRGADLGGNTMNQVTYRFNKPPPPSVCGDNLVEQDEECEPPGSLVCDVDCTMLVQACVESSTGTRRVRGGDDDQGEDEDDDVAAEDSVVTQLANSDFAQEVSDMVFDFTGDIGLREEPEEVNGIQLANVAVDAFACQDVKTEEVLLQRKEVPYTPPTGFEILREPVQFSCAGAFETTLSLPDEYTNVQAVKCVGGACNTIEITSAQSIQCGNEVVYETEKSDADIAQLEITGLARQFDPERYSVEAVGSDERKYTVVRHQDAYQSQIHRSLKLLSAPILVSRRSPQEFSGQEMISVSLPYVDGTSLVDGSVQVFAFDPDQRLWALVPGAKIDEENLKVSVELDFQQFAEGGREGVFAVMGRLCQDCEKSYFTNVYQSPEGQRSAVVLVHDLGGDSQDWNYLVQDIIRTRQPWQVWSFDYDSVQNLKQASRELADSLQIYNDRYDSVFIVSHGVGGLITQEALSFAHRENYINPNRYRFIPKVKKAVLIGTPNEVIETEGLMMTYYNYLVNSGKANLFEPEKIKSLLANRPHIPQVPGIDYFVIAGNQKPSVDEGFVSATLLDGVESDGLVPVRSAQRVGGELLNDQCTNYWEIGASHLDLIKHPSSRKVIGQLISADLERNFNESALIGHQQYFCLVDANCSSDDSYVLIGKKVNKKQAADPTGCSCGNGFCGVDEDEVSCPSDCTGFVRAENYPKIFAAVATLMLVMITVASYSFWTGSGRSILRNLKPKIKKK